MNVFLKFIINKIYSIENIDFLQGLSYLFMMPLPPESIFENCCLHFKTVTVMAVLELTKLSFGFISGSGVLNVLF